MARSKYNARRTTVDGITFDSGAESRRYSELVLLERAKDIRGLERQPRFRLEVGGVHVCTYVADFSYWRGDERIVEDVKGVRTATFIIKKKLMRAIYGIDVVEVRAR